MVPGFAAQCLGANIRTMGCVDWLHSNFVDSALCIFFRKCTAVFVVVYIAYSNGSCWEWFWRKSVSFFEETMIRMIGYWSESKRKATAPKKRSRKRKELHRFKDRINIKNNASSGTVSTNVDLNGVRTQWFWFNPWSQHGILVGSILQHHSNTTSVAMRKRLPFTSQYEHFAAVADQYGS